MRNPVEILQRLEAEPATFDFFAALRRIECAYPDKPRIGQSQRPQDDAVRFGQPPSLSFAHSMIDSFTPASGSQPAPRLEVNFFGLLGANGPMPVHLTEYIRDRVRNANDPTLARFLDMFHHRMIALFYRSWANAQPAVSLDRPESDRFADYVGSLIGIGMKSLHDRDAAPDFAKLHYAGRLSAHARNAEGLAAILSDFFRLPVVLKEFVGHWMTLPADGRCRLRSGPDAEVLGMTTVLGSKVWNCQHKFRIEIGPVDFAQYQHMLPGGESIKRLVAWVRNYAGVGYNWDVNLILKKEEVPRLTLGNQSRLGWTTWLNSHTPKQDDRQLLLNPINHINQL
ncbi:type VI secretion system baseplate subunit TssG [Noviherbaspirillum sp.]|uniref:type VI secretion system baseplate subunit TssG n=1 Tax=Noviherbaspirillum sp. TaxID=1926288 RepID=UPI002FDF81E1